MKNADQPAHPTSETVHTGFGQSGDKLYATVISNGLSKREYFAGLAMQGLLASYTQQPCRASEVAVDSLKAADELLKQLEA